MMRVVALSVALCATHAVAGTANANSEAEAIQAQAMPPPMHHDPAPPQMEHTFPMGYPMMEEPEMDGMRHGGMMMGENPEMEGGIHHGRMHHGHGCHMMPVVFLAISLAGIFVAIRVANRQGFSTPAHGCFSDPLGCLLTMCCPCVAYGRVAQLSFGVPWYLMCCAVTCCHNLACCFGLASRFELRRKLNIEGHWCGDACIHACAAPCALCQELREVDMDVHELRGPVGSRRETADVWLSLVAHVVVPLAVPAGEGAVGWRVPGPHTIAPKLRVPRALVRAVSLRPRKDACAIFQPASCSCIAVADAAIRALRRRVVPRRRGFAHRWAGPIVGFAVLPVCVTRIRSIRPPKPIAVASGFLIAVVETDPRRDAVGYNLREDVSVMAAVDTGKMPTTCNALILRLQLRLGLFSVREVSRVAASVSVTTVATHTLVCKGTVLIVPKPATLWRPADTVLTAMHVISNTIGRANAVDNTPVVRLTRAAQHRAWG